MPSSYQALVGWTAVQEWMMQPGRLPGGGSRQSWRGLCCKQALPSALGTCPTVAEVTESAPGCPHCALPWASDRGRSGAVLVRWPRWLCLGACGTPSTAASCINFPVVEASSSILCWGQPSDLTQALMTYLSVSASLPPRSPGFAGSCLKSDPPHCSSAQK